MACVLLQRTFGRHVFPPLAQLLLRPVPWIANELARFKRERLAHTDRLIGVHIRRGIQDAMCADHGIMTQEDLSVAAMCSMAIGAVHESIGRNVTYFVASDSEASRAEVHEWLATGGTGRRVVSYDEHAVHRTSVRGVQRALVELHLLKDCDDLVIGAFSSYAKIAAAHHSKRLPYMVTYEKQCVHPLTSDPCFLLWSVVEGLSCAGDVAFTPDLVFDRICDLSKFQAY